MPTRPSRFDRTTAYYREYRSISGAFWERTTGSEVDIAAADWDDALRRLQAGEFDVIDSMVETAERRADFEFTPPYEGRQAVLIALRRLGTPVYCPLPPEVVTALARPQNEPPEYFFWNGKSERETTVKSWNRVCFKNSAVTLGALSV